MDDMSAESGTPGGWGYTGCMSEQEPQWGRKNLANPHTVADKARRVERMFDAIAPSYDLNNRVHSLGRDVAWRRATVGMAGVSPGDLVLDVACGTGDLSQAFIDAGVERVVGADFTPGMLRVAMRKAEAKREYEQRTRYIAADALALPLGDEMFDVVSIAFGLRNVADPAVAVAEFWRVLRPGGRLVVLEFGQPRNRLLNAMYQFYFRHVLPRTAAAVARDTSGAYRYLPQSVATFLDREGVERLLAEQGFESVEAKSLTFGIAWCFVGAKTASL